jgi:myo-inositol-1(or 4)-monophosphatase
MNKQLPVHSPVPLERETLVEYLEFANRLADASGSIIAPYFRAPLVVDNKGGAADYDPVTAADTAAEDALRKLIHRTYPDQGIFGEERGYEAGESGLTWVIDPIDGTKAFITGLPVWGTLIALYDGEKPVLGVMDQPFTGERFLGSPWGAELNTETATARLQTRACPSLSRAILQTTHPDMFSTDAEGRAFDEVAQRVRLARFGGDCYAYCMLAYGLIDLVIEAGLAPYDIQALIPIVEAAGGMVSTWSGASAAYGGQIVAAGDPRLHAQVVAILSGFNGGP